MVWAVVFPSKTPEKEHPYAERSAEHVVRVLTSAAKEARSSGGKKDGKTTTSAKHEEAISRLTSLCAFIKGAAASWPISVRCALPWLVR